MALPVNNASDSGAVVAQETDIPALRQLASAAFAQSRFRAPWYAPDASSRFYAQWIENAVRGTFDHQCLILRAASGDIRGYVSYGNSMRQMRELACWLDAVQVLS